VAVDARPAPGAARGAIAFLADLSLLVHPAARIGVVGRDAGANRGRCLRSSTHAVRPFEAVAFKLPMLLLVLSILGILDGR
jgi:hypothetical protein